MWPWVVGIGCAGVILLGGLAVVLVLVFGKTDMTSLFAFGSSDKGEVGDNEQASDDLSAEELANEGKDELDEAQETDNESAGQAEGYAETPTPASIPSAPKGGDSGGAGQQLASTQMVTVPLGTKVAVSLSSELSTKTHNANDSWQGTLTSAVVVNGGVVWPAGTRVRGVVQQSVPTGRLSNGKGILAVQLTEIGGTGINGGVNSVTGEPKTDRNAKVIGGTAAMGAIVGALSKKNNKADAALGGAAIGAAAGTGLAAATADTTVKMPSTITFTIPANARIAVKNR
jgi:hypothetical protein